MSEGAGLIVAGVGNRYRQDDGVGLHLVAKYRPEADQAVAAELWEDFDGAAVAHRLVELACPVLIVDCAEMGLPGGAFRVFDCREVLNLTTGSVVSTHGIGLAQGIQLATALNYTEPLRVFAVQPFTIGMGGELSLAMVNLLPELQRGMASAVAEMIQSRVAG